MIDYDPHDWRSHLWDIKGSMVRELRYRILLVTLIASAATFVDELWIPVHVNPVAHTLIGAFLSLLLVFRTNASYDKFWEGRKQWGTIVNETRNLARKAANWMAEDVALMHRLLRWTAVFPFAVMYVLRGVKTVGPAPLELPHDEVLAVDSAPHPALAVATIMARIIEEARIRRVITEYQQVSIDNDVQILVDAMGACERIRKTPIPFAYMVHLRRALIIYLFTLPFALVEPFGWGTIPASAIISFILFGIEEIGVEIEEPFGEDDNDLPLERICETIRTNIDQVGGFVNSTTTMVLKV
ncbi:MAG: hypothetical protein FJX76_18515 [Armatimonadetes bacterium]|nr:hypothetical protein [Armatimonadota bacterium]